MRTCPDCHAQLDDRAAFCDNCGLRLTPAESPAAPAPAAPRMPAPAGPAAAGTCSACGYLNIPGEMYCQNCGVQLAPVASAPPPPPQPVSWPLPVEPPPAPVAAPAPKPAAESPAPVVCTVCGTRNQPGEIFCENCGVKLPEISAGAPAPPAAPAKQAERPPVPGAGGQAPLIPAPPVAPPPVPSSGPGTAAPPPAAAPVPAPAPQKPAASPAAPVPAPAGQKPAASPAAPGFCPTCGTPYGAGQLYCQNCGLFLGGAQATPLSDQVDFSTSPIVNPPEPAVETGVPGQLVLALTKSALPLPAHKQEALIGRADPTMDHFPDVDLTPFGGDTGGVSRKHARLVARDGQVFIEDLNSVNKTYLNKQKLVPGQQYPLKDGDEILMGRLVLIYSKSTG